MDRQPLIEILNEIGLLLELKGENPFKSRAYLNAARVIENLDPDQELLFNEGRINELPGFGAALAGKVAEWRQTGTMSYYEELKQSIPPGLPELLRVPGLGAKKISLLHRQLGISSLEELECACQQNKLLGLPGFGAKTQAKLLAGIAFVREHQGQYLLMEVRGIASQLLRQLQQYPGVERAELAGSLRRCKEVVGDLDLVAASGEPEAVIGFFIALPEVATVIGHGPTKASVTLRNGVNADLRAVKPEEYPHALHHFTGSKEHNTELRHWAKELGFKVNEYGLFQGETPMYCRDEAEIYRQLQLDYIPPPLREGRGELEAAREKRLPRLAQPEDLRGIFHCHTNYSDGVNSLREMVEAAIELGYEYLGITDHSRTAFYAGGLNVAAVERQREEIEALNREFPNFTIFKGIESDILPNGELDYPDEILAQFDFVIGSVHSHFRMEREAMTARVLKALDNPYLTMLGHPTGRILLQRPAYEIDLEAVIDRAVGQGVIIEFNANPYRFDLDWRWCRKVREQGGRITINPDAHGVAELSLARSGLAVAVKGWLEPKDIFNTQSVAQIKAFLLSRRALVD